MDHYNDLTIQFIAELQTLREEGWIDAFAVAVRWARHSLGRRFRSESIQRAEEIIQTNRSQRNEINTETQNINTGQQTQFKNITPNERPRPPSIVADGNRNRMTVTASIPHPPRDTMEQSTGDNQEPWEQRSRNQEPGEEQRRSRDPSRQQLRDQEPRERRGDREPWEEHRQDQGPGRTQTPGATGPVTGRPGPRGAAMRRLTDRGPTRQNHHRHHTETRTHQNDTTETPQNNSNMT